MPKFTSENKSGRLLKVKPMPDYPPEEGGYRGVEKISFLRGNDYSPVAVVVILDTFDFKITYQEQLVKASIEAGAALAGMLQTENIGIEKIVANVVANPNIRYLVLCGRESPGHLPGDALTALMRDGVDDGRNIIGSKAPTPYLYNIPIGSIERFRKQIKLINLLSDDDPTIGVKPETVKEAVWACCQEKPIKFMGYTLYDPGAYPEPPMCYKITWRVTQPWRPILTEKEKRIIERIKEAATKAAKRKGKGPTLAELLGIKKKES